MEPADLWTSTGKTYKSFNESKQTELLSSYMVLSEHDTADSNKIWSKIDST